MHLGNPSFKIYQRDHSLIPEVKKMPHNPCNMHFLVHLNSSDGRNSSQPFFSVSPSSSLLPLSKPLLETQCTRSPQPLNSVDINSSTTNICLLPLSQHACNHFLSSSDTKPGRSVTTAGVPVSSTIILQPLRVCMHATSFSSPCSTAACAI